MASAPTWATRLRSVIRGGALVRLHDVVQWALLVALADLADDDGELHPDCEPTAASLGAQVRVGERTARRGLQALADVELVLITQVPGAPSRFALNTSAIELVERAPHRWGGRSPANPAALPTRQPCQPGSPANPAGEGCQPGSPTPANPAAHPCQPGSPLPNGLDGLGLDRGGPDIYLPSGGAAEVQAVVLSPTTAAPVTAGASGPPMLAPVKLPSGFATWTDMARRLADDGINYAANLVAQIDGGRLTLSPKQRKMLVEIYEREVCASAPGTPSTGPPKPGIARGRPRAGPAVQRDPTGNFGSAAARAHKAETPLVDPEGREF